ncbi:MAG: hypothetical protein JSR72_17715 [Proteobacteria bacterium]|nr:hypothetical protein [Pseudomonadota bacterium]
MLARFVVRTLLIGCIASGLAACKQDGSSPLAAQQPRGATVAFDVIDGLPQTQFQKLVERLNDEAQSRRLAVVSRDGASAYRVRGALTATVDRGQTTIAWTWDVFDGTQQRVLQIKGEETGANTVKADEAWKVADDAMLQRIAQSSMDKLTAFLTSPEVVPGAAAAPAVAFDNTSPEAAGIYRIQSSADPLQTGSAQAPAMQPPLPQKRPAAVHAARQTRPAATVADNAL